MRTCAILILVGIFTVSVPLSHASDLVFPTTETEIVETLSNNDDRAEINGTVYEYQGQKLYKVINGKRFRMRGIRVMEAYSILPKAGALVHFDLESARIQPSSYHLLDEFGKALRGQLNTSVVMIAGHTDNTGTAAYNQNLSEQRAKAVVDYLIIRCGISKQRLMVHGYGETQPFQDNITEVGRTQNRRVEFIRIE